MLGWNFYMPVMTSTLGLHMMPSLYNIDGTPKHNEDLTLPYPDLSKFSIYSSHTPTYTKDQILNKCEDNLIRQWIECNLE